MDDPGSDIVNQIEAHDAKIEKRKKNALKELRKAKEMSSVPTAEYNPNYKPVTDIDEEEEENNKTNATKNLTKSEKPTDNFQPVQPLPDDSVISYFDEDPVNKLPSPETDSNLVEEKREDPKPPPLEIPGGDYTEDPDTNDQDSKKKMRGLYHKFNRHYTTSSRSRLALCSAVSLLLLVATILLILPNDNPDLKHRWPMIIGLCLLFFAGSVVFLTGSYVPQSPFSHREISCWKPSGSDSTTGGDSDSGLGCSDVNFAYLGYDQIGPRDDDDADDDLEYRPYREVETGAKFGARFKRIREHEEPDVCRACSVTKIRVARFSLAFAAFLGTILVIYSVLICMFGKGGLNNQGPDVVGDPDGTSAGVAEDAGSPGLIEHEAVSDFRYTIGELQERMTPVNSLPEELRVGAGINYGPLADSDQSTVQALIDGILDETLALDSADAGGEVRRTKDEFLTLLINGVLERRESHLASVGEVFEPLTLDEEIELRSQLRSALKPFVDELYWPGPDPYQQSEFKHTATELLALVESGEVSLPQAGGLRSGGRTVNALIQEILEEQQLQDQELREALSGTERVEHSAKGMLQILLDGIKRKAEEGSGESIVLTPEEQIQLQTAVVSIVDQFYGAQLRYSLPAQISAIQDPGYTLPAPVEATLSISADDPAGVQADPETLEIPTKEYIERMLDQALAADSPAAASSDDPSQSNLFLDYNQFLAVLTAGPLTEAGSDLTSSQRDQLRVALIPFADARYGFPQHSIGDLRGTLQRNTAAGADTRLVELVNGNPGYDIPVGTDETLSVQTSSNMDTVLEGRDDAGEISYAEFVDLMIENTVTGDRDLAPEEVVALRAYLGPRLERW